MLKDKTAEMGISIFNSLQWNNALAFTRAAQIND